MDHTRFRKPVDILVGLGFPRRIESAIEGYILLQDWPHADRNRAHAIALNACKAAIAGDVDPETAYAAFTAFADRQGLLLPSQAAWRPERTRPLRWSSSVDPALQWRGQR